jgi:K+:H+ antiporter
MSNTILGNIIIILALSASVIFVFLRLRIPAIVGFILSGILAGPQVLGLIKAQSDVEAVAELGVVLLLFSIGIEFSIKNIMEVGRRIFFGGSIQVIATVALVYGIAMLLKFDSRESILFGILISMSSTAIVLKMLDERAETTSENGNNTLSILIFQDLLVVPLMILIPLLGEGRLGIQEPAVFFLGKALLLVLFLYASYKYLVPLFLHQIARTRSRELFLISIILLCFGVAWITSLLGLSLALGAFLAGLIISESQYNQEALGRILPLRDIFMSLFFISIGMLLDIPFLLEHIWMFLGLAACIVMMKTFTGSFATIALGYPLRSAVLVGLALAQVGEFSFILSRSALEHGILHVNDYQTFLGISLITMVATPFIINGSPHIADLAMRIPWQRTLSFGMKSHPLITSDANGMKKHLVIIGYGVVGRNVAHSARLAGIPYVIIDMNPETVRAERKKGEPIHYGDATQEAILKHVRIEESHVVVITIPEIPTSRRITELARRLNPAGYIISRTRFVTEVGPLYDLGADEVVPEEFETSIEIFARALAEYLIPRDDIEQFIEDLRSSGYRMFRSLSGDATNICNLQHEIPGFKITTYKIRQDSMVAGRSLADLEMRKKYRVSILAIRRGDKTIINPGGDTLLLTDDQVIVSGDIGSILSVNPVFNKDIRQIGQES